MSQRDQSSVAYELCKRAVDLAIAVGALILFAPLWVVIGLAIRLTSPGPALFRRTVIGRNGRPFIYFKFRTMRSGDDTHHREWLANFVLADAPYADGAYKVRDDPRVTPLGRLLRRTSVDEVPQFVNVLMGDMSIVGPRPPIEYEYALYDEHARLRLTVKPGITGLYQVTARSQVPFSEMLALDLQYIASRSLRLDFCIMVRTAKVMFTGEGAG